MANASLLVIQGVDQGARFELGDAPVSLGRGVQNEIRVLDTEVSRSHATIQPLNGTYVITDRHSSNGTFVNGVPIRSRELVNGDQIQIGRTLLLFNGGSEDGSRLVSEKIDLVSRHDPADRSSIVSEVGHETERLVTQRAELTTSQAVMQSMANLRLLYRISEEAVRPSVSIDQLLQQILDLTIEVVGAERGCVLLAEPESSEVVPQVFSQRRGVEAHGKMTVSRSIVDYVLRRRQGVRTSDAQRDTRFEPGQSILQAGIREAMCVPMEGRFELMGVIYVDITTPPERVLLDGGAPRFNEDQLRLLVAIGRQAALAIENNRYQQALVKAERLAAMGQTIATLSHHIKNILQGVRGGSYLVEMGLKDHNEELVHRGWKIVEKNQSKIYHLVMDMLTFSKERQPALERASVNDTVRDVCELMQVRADECRVSLQCRLADELPASTFDPEGIHRAVLNIVTNAIDAAEGVPEATVLVETGYHRESDHLFVSVTDNGPGIPPEQRQRIFNIFESTKGARGTGLGLAVSQKILREHGGEITVESEVGRGSRFTLAWPRMDEEQGSGINRTIA